MLAGEWPERPSPRFLGYWSLRRDELCELALCPDAPEDGDHCPLNRLEQAEQSEPGVLLRRALDVRAASRVSIQIGLDDAAADKFHALLVLDEEREKCRQEETRS